MPQVHGASKDVIDMVGGIVETEINSVTDNPIVFHDEDAIMSGGNFHGQPLALNLDFLAIAVAELANISERRTYLLISGQRNLPPFLHQVWRTSPTLTLASLGLRLLRALLPVAMLYVGKLIIDEAVRLAGAGGLPPLREALASGLLDPLLGLLALEFGLAIASDLLGRLVSYADALLSELFANATSIRLMEHAATLDLEDFEDPDLQDKLDRARRQTMGRMNLMSQLFGQVQDAITVASLAVGLVVAFVSLSAPHVFAAIVSR